jgi:hypothetical protein
MVRSRATPLDDGPAKAVATMVRLKAPATDDRAIAAEPVAGIDSAA